MTKGFTNDIKSTNALRIQKNLSSVKKLRKNDMDGFKPQEDQATSFISSMKNPSVTNFHKFNM